MWKMKEGKRKEDLGLASFDLPFILLAYANNHLYVIATGLQPERHSLSFWNLFQGPLRANSDLAEEEDTFTAHRQLQQVSYTRLTLAISDLQNQAGAWRMSALHTKKRWTPCWAAGRNSSFLLLPIPGHLTVMSKAFGWRGVSGSSCTFVIQFKKKMYCCPVNVGCCQHHSAAHIQTKGLAKQGYALGPSLLDVWPIFIIAF